MSDEPVDGVERVQVSTAYGSGPEGGNSAWVVPDAGVVVDPGPPGDNAFEHLESGLDDAGLALGDVEDVLVTHWHVDHAGLAPRLATAADATLSMHELDAPLVAAYAVERERRVERDAATLARWGVPEEHVDALREADSPSPMPDSVAVNSLIDGDSVGPLTVLETPGHTAGHVAFALDGDDDGGENDDDGDDDSGTALVGDAVLRTVTPNVGGGDTRQESPLSAYRDALAALDGDFDIALPGHGTAFELGPRVAELRAHHRERAALVHESLNDLSGGNADGVTPWTVAGERFGDMDGYHVKFGAGEAYAHLADLEAMDLVERVGEDPLRYRVARSSEESVQSRLDAAWGV